MIRRGGFTKRNSKANKLNAAAIANSKHGQGGGESDEKGSPIEGAGMRWAKPLEGMDKAIYADINYLQAPLGLPHLMLVTLGLVKISPDLTAYGGR